MAGFALFRLPYAQECTLITGAVKPLASCRSLSGQQGFVVSPFALSMDEPLLLIQPERVEHYPHADAVEVQGAAGFDRIVGCSPSSPSSGQRTDYHIDFANFHAHLLNGDFQKLVLSRSIVVERQDEDSPQDLFRKACQRYPRMFISLVYTPQSGLWLVATPEILLAGSGKEWQTVALAGTMPYSDNVRWSDKNIQEQRFVATYVTEQLEQFTRHFDEDGPHTIRAGHLAHLRSDFHFILHDPACIGELLHALHPTPAVCGLPKQQAISFIRQNEHHNRSYYSGFMGPLFVDGQTHLFVTLRCMQLFQHSYRLYAGGGLLRESTEEHEWQETETKLDTMRNLLS